MEKEQDHNKIESNNNNNKDISIMNKTQTKGLKRNIIDKFYTKPDVATQCLQYLKDHIQIGENDIIVEPSAGNGSFISGIKSLTSQFKFYDIAPEHPEIIQQDYLKGNYDGLVSDVVSIHVVGNPPFGRQSSLAIQFIKKSCEFSNSVSFILPKSFKKESLQKSFPPHFHLIFEQDIPHNSFLVENVEHDVPCVFQIWVKKPHMRNVAIKLSPNNFVFVDKTAEPDISFRRVGVNAGKIETKIDEKSIQSHYFIKFTNGKPLEENLEKISKIEYDFNNTVGPKSISKQELICKFNPLL